MDLPAPPPVSEFHDITKGREISRKVFFTNIGEGLLEDYLYASTYELTANSSIKLWNKSERSVLRNSLFQHQLTYREPQFALTTTDEPYINSQQSDAEGKIKLSVSQSGNHMHGKIAVIEWKLVEPTLDQGNIEDSDQWIDPFDHSNNQDSTPFYPEWEDISPAKIKQVGLTWELVKESDILAIETPITKEPRIIPALESVNRSIAFNTGAVGPDISFLVPTGFRWSPNVPLDFSVRGWNRRQKGQDFLAWNNGDAVGQIFLQNIQAKKWSLGASLGIRSLYQSERFAGGSSKIGEGVSAGFRFDYALSDTSGIAIGAEQLIHFDSFTDTGRDIYLVASKGWWLGGEAGQFPLATVTAGIGTGYLGRNPYLQFGCSNFIDAGIAQAGNDTFYPLCWGPIASGALVINPKLSLFSEFNNFAFVTGASFAPFEELPLRATWGVTLAQDFGGGTEDFRFEPDKARWFFRVSVGL